MKKFKYFILLPLFGLVLAPIAIATTAASDPTDDVLRSFDQQCATLEDINRKGLRILTDLDKAGYFEYFCHTIAFQRCSDFNGSLKGIGQLTDARGDRCKFEPETDSMPSLVER